MANRVVLGRRGNGEYGLFVSPPGVDAVSASDASLAFSTNILHSFSVVQKGLVSTGTSGDFITVSFPTMPYIPMVIIGYYVNSRYRYTQSVQNIGPSPFSVSAWGPWALITNNSIRFQSGMSNQFFHYAVLRMPGGN